MSDQAERRRADLRLLGNQDRALRMPAPGVSDAFPARSGGTGHLPFPVSSFVGRSAELERTADLLASTRLLTITGSGGCGKTRLAIELARQRDGQLAGCTWFVDLAPLRAGEHVLTEIAAVLGVEEPERGRNLTEAIVGFLGSGSFLVVLDNCEHVRAAASSAAGAMLLGAAGLRILATSREPLSIPGEVTWRVPELDGQDAAALFAERARQASPDISLDTEQQRTAISGICQRLDGLPLAIELAAARARSLSLARIAATLDQRFDLLTDEPMATLSRHMTLRASFEWSLELLSPAERDLLGQLAVFAGGFGLDDALSVCPDATLASLARLADRNLLTVLGAQEGEPRYRMLETVRELAAERLAEDSGQAALTRRRHAEHYLALAETAEPQLTRQWQDEWLARLVIDYDNLRAALSWCRDEPVPELCGRLAAALVPYWLERSQWSECRLWLEAAAAMGRLPAVLRARILTQRCYLEIWAGDAARVPGLAGESLTLLSGLDEPVAQGRALGFLSAVTAARLGPEAARPQMESALALMRAGGDDWGLAMALAFFADFRLFQADPDEPRRMLEEAVEITTASGDRRTLRLALTMAALAAVTQGRIAEAGRRAERAADSARQAGHTGALIRARFVQAWVLLLEGKPGAAATTAQECYTVGRDSGEGGEGLALWLQAEAALAQADPARALRLLTEARDLTATDNTFAALPVLASAEALFAAGDRAAAAAAADEAATLAGRTGRIWILGRVNLVRARYADDPMTAESHVHAAMALGRDAGDTLGLVEGLELAAALAADRGADAEALRLWAAAAAARARLGYAYTIPASPSHQQRIDALLRAASPPGVPAAWTEGDRLSIEEALAYASRGRGRRRRPATGWASLTPTELEVTRLVAGHLSNPEISERLFISRATVKTHLVHIFAKLGVRSRSQLTAEAIRRGLG
jgi:predicted ATPase/DNA-binding CsgD family transcriptional regulator